ncbi:ABC transporter permease [Phytohabitans kaempferiae]|uniref:ABC transporter permease n=1 Tax=Phytohabitans kaempferiae TaxID=1620943 RepID=A0ABV6M815_9ACTN
MRGKDALPSRRGQFLASPWLRFAVRRASRLVLSVLVLITVSFFMIHLIPGDPIRAALGIDAPQALVDARREALGLNDPILTQYFRYLLNLISGQWGQSLSSGEPVMQVIASRLPASLQIAVPSFMLALLIGVPLGVTMAALTRGGRRPRTELTFTTTSIVIDAIPGYFLAVALVFVFGVSLGILPVAGRSGPESFIIPVLAVATAPAAMIARIVRVEVLAVLQADHVRTARAKRLRPWAVYLRHALPNAATATLTIAGMMLGGMIAGTVLIEKVISWPGIGGTMATSIIEKDYPVVQGIILVLGATVLVINLVVDVLLAVLDPRSTILER